MLLIVVPLFYSSLTGGGGGAGDDGEKDEYLNIFSLASGHLYERLMRIMILSIVKQTKSPVKFWLLKNYLSPEFKVTDSTYMVCALFTGQLMYIHIVTVQLLMTIVSLLLTQRHSGLLEVRPCRIAPQRRDIVYEMEDLLS